MPPFDFFPVLFLTFPILVWLVDSVASEPDVGVIRRLIDGFKPGFAFGFGYFFAGLWWIGNAFLVEAESFAWALPIAVVALPVLLAIFWGLATSLARLMWVSESFCRLFVLAACFMLFEYLRGFVATGFPWNALSYAVYVTPVSMQSASVFGIYGMTGFTVFLFSIFATFVPSEDYRSTGRKRVFFLAAILATAHLGYGIWRIPTEPVGLVEDVKLRLVQPAIPQEEKFDKEKEAQVIRTLMDVSTSQSQTGKEGLSEITHVIWPESSFPFFLTNRRDVLASIASMLPENTTLITGAARYETSSGSRDDFVFNSVYVINDAGEIISAADKVHLVPFGEYLPFQNLAESFGIQQLTKIQGGFTAGSSRKLLSTDTAPTFLPLICYEIIFSGALWDETQRPGWIINLTNDAWFGNTPGPYQHERFSMLRAVEEGVPIVRVANTGISGVYDPYGITQVRLKLGERGAIDASLPKSLEKTIFTTHGQQIYWLTLLGFFVLGLFSFRYTSSR